MRDTKLESLKEVLYLIYLIDMQTNKFHNKVNFMNLNHLIGRVGDWGEPQISKSLEQLRLISKEINKVSAIIDDISPNVAMLIESYDTNKHNQTSES